MVLGQCFLVFYDIFCPEAWPNLRHQRQMTEDRNLYSVIENEIRRWKIVAGSAIFLLAVGAISATVFLIL